MVENALDEFRSIVAEAEARTKAGDADGANAEIANLDALVDRLDDPKSLVPLTDSTESPAVRFNAAASLLGLGHADIALPVLDELDAEDSSVASVDARTLASYWRRKNP